MTRFAITRPALALAAALVLPPALAPAATIAS